MKRPYSHLRAIVAVLVMFVPTLFANTGMTPRWIVHYGGHITKNDVHDVDWAIVDQDVDPKALANGRTKFIAYVSVGEAEDYRDYWAQVKHAPFLVAKNENWQGAHLVDIRSARWRDILFGHTLAKIAKKGFDGVFLDTIDTAIYLEDRDASAYEGSKDALVALVKEIRRRYPNFLIVPNNGLEVLPRIADVVDAVLVEDLYTAYDFKTKKSRRTPRDVSNQKEKILDDFRARHRKPVLNILYDTSDKTALIRYAVKRSRAKGYSWYRTTVDLMSVGTMNP